MRGPSEQDMYSVEQRPAASATGQGLSAKTAQLIIWLCTGGAAVTMLLAVIVAICVCSLRESPPNEPNREIAKENTDDDRDEQVEQPVNLGKKTREPELVPIRAEPKVSEGTRRVGVKDDSADGNEAMTDLRRKNGLLALPERSQGLGSASVPATEIARIKASPNVCRLELRGSEAVLDGGLEFYLKEDDKADGSRTWAVRAVNKQSLGGGKNVACFSLKDESLKFQWDPTVKPSAQPEKLSCCTLEVRVGKEPPVVCSLIQPQFREDLQVQDLCGEVRMAIPWRQAIAAFKCEQLRIDVRLKAFPPHEMQGQLPLGNADLLTFEFSKADPKDPHGYLSLEMRCDIEEGKAVSLVLNSFAYLPNVTAEGARRELLTKTALERWRLAISEAKIKVLQTQKTKLETTEIPRLKKHLALENAQRTAPTELSVSTKYGSLSSDIQKQRQQRDRVREVEGLIKAAEAQVTLREKMIAQTKVASQWYQRLERLLDDMTRGRIEYRLYAEVKETKKQIVLVESKSFGNGGQPGGPR